MYYKNYYFTLNKVGRGPAHNRNLLSKAPSDPFPIAVNPIELAILPLVPIAPHPHLVRVTHDPVSLLPGIAIVAPGPFTIDPNMFG